jgi:hypothetical protein
VIDWNNCSWKAPIIHLILNPQLTGNESHHPNRQRIATPTDSQKKKVKEKCIIKIHLGIVIKAGAGSRQREERVRERRVVMQKG